MSNITIAGNAAGTATFTVASPATSTNRTLTLPDATGTLATTTDSITQAQLTTALNATGSAPMYACRAWVNFNGTGTVAIRASGNVSSITDNGVGDYTINFTTAMPDANFGVSGSSAKSSDTNQTAFSVVSPISLAAGSVRVLSGVPRDTGNIGALEDALFVSVAIFR